MLKATGAHGNLLTILVIWVDSGCGRNVEECGNGICCDHDMEVNCKWFSWCVSVVHRG